MAQLALQSRPTSRFGKLIAALGAALRALDRDDLLRPFLVAIGVAACLSVTSAWFYFSWPRDYVNACLLSRRAVQARMAHPFWIEADTFCKVDWSGYDRGELVVSGLFRGPNARRLIIVNEYRVVLNRREGKLAITTVDYDDHRNWSVSGGLGSPRVTHEVTSVLDPVPRRSR
jgi:hypothetical protein